ncbi:SDR family oxidoreductase [Paraburkholderia sp.]|uniref:SDR family oxidoreductase n=1 Tax=Paraburkholderia sp. TaxID=1926495 RepID=UPI00286F8B7F|nr:SDR family oxidoreductase [Paraburkholderia sp.]
MRTTVRDLGVAVVSGASGGIGRAIAAKLCDDGYTVIMLGRDRRNLDAACATMGGEGEGLRIAAGNMESDAAIAELVAANGGDDIVALVHAAGSGSVARLAATTEATWQEVFEGKLFTAVRLVRALAPKMRRPSPAGIVFVDGVFAYQPDPHFVINSAVNCALAGFAKAIARDFIRDGIRVNVVHPGVTDTDLWHQVADEIAPHLNLTGGEAVTAAIAASLLGGRITAPEDIADTVSFLLSQSARHITGVSITVDGGEIRNLV